MKDNSFVYLVMATANSDNENYIVQYSDIKSVK